MTPEKLTDKQARRKRRWQADMAAVSEALDRLGVPPFTNSRVSESRMAPDEEPCPALMERLGWLEGHVAALRSPDPTPRPYRRALRICGSCKTITVADPGERHDMCGGFFEDLKT